MLAVHAFRYHPHMPNIQIRDVPEATHRQLKSQAARAGQSLNEYLLARVEDIAQTWSWPELLEEVSKHGPYTGPPISEIAAMIRKDRDSH
jgi:hypothetical protein